MGKCHERARKAMLLVKKEKTDGIKMNKSTKENTACKLKIANEMDGGGGVRGDTGLVEKITLNQVVASIPQSFQH